MTQGKGPDQNNVQNYQDNHSKEHNNQNEHEETNLAPDQLFLNSMKSHIMHN